jgi:hypothetical protein
MTGTVRRQDSRKPRRDLVVRGLVHRLYPQMPTSALVDGRVPVVLPAASALAPRLLTALRRATRPETGEVMESSGTRLREILERIQKKYQGSPGLRLTSSQAERLWHVDSCVSDALLMALVDARFLSRTPDGAYVRRS